MFFCLILDGVPIIDLFFVGKRENKCMMPLTGWVGWVRRWCDYDTWGKPPFCPLPGWALRQSQSVAALKYQYKYN